jgi:Ras-associated and pleckstrin homology domains-containing protein 1
LVVENLEDWTADSPNKLHFVRLPQKWLLFQQPELFLLDERSRGGDHEFPPADRRVDWDTQQRHRLLEPFLQEEGGSRVPELEGWLLLKADGKKSWRRHFFVLRASGLYFVAKPGKPRGPTRDLQCLMSGVNSQVSGHQAIGENIIAKINTMFKVYTCTDWRKKYKAPTDWGFAIKHPRIQVKTSKYIK